MDRVYNHDVYAAKTASLTAALGSTIKTAVIANQSPSSQDIDNFVQIYARQEVGKINSQILCSNKNANTSQANKLAMDLKSLCHSLCNLLWEVCLWEIFLIHHEHGPSANPNHKELILCHNIMSDLLIMLLQ